MSENKEYYVELIGVETIPFKIVHNQCITKLKTNQMVVLKV